MDKLQEALEIGLELAKEEAELCRLKYAGYRYDRIEEAEEGVRKIEAAIASLPVDPVSAFNQAEFDTMVEKGTNAWAGQEVPRRDGELSEMCRDAEFYRYVRTLNPRQFTDLWTRNLNGTGAFDDLVAQAIRETRA
jgi:hypothetical protein